MNLLGQLKIGGKRLTALILVIGTALLALAAVLSFSGRHNGALQYRKAPVQRGDVVRTVAASGTLEAITTVLVGSQVSGQITELAVDFNSPVKAGQIIARLDSGAFKTRVREAEANLALAQASLEKDRAAVERVAAELKTQQSGLVAFAAEEQKAKAGLRLTALELARYEKLYHLGLISKSRYEEAGTAQESNQEQLKAASARRQSNQSSVDAQRAQVKSTIAQVKHGQADVRQKEAALDRARIDLANTVIRSPVNGVVINRNVDNGQTVAASLQAPTLFTIAQDLKRMQVLAAIDEADVGAISVGQPARFTVDSFPGETFTGAVVQVRKAARIVQNVVTYDVVISAGNPRERLLPGMTANVTIEVQRRAGVLKVPTAALRFQPPEGAVFAQPLDDGKGAQPAAAVGPGGGNTQRGGGGERGATRGNGGGAGGMGEMLRQLALTAEQQSRLRDLTADSRDALRKLRGGETSPEELAQQRRKFRDLNRKILLDLLSPEQKVRFETLSRQQAAAPVVAGQVWVLEANGALRRERIGTGVNDGTFAEVARGGLQEGQEVATGLQVESTAAGGQSRLRLRF